MKRLEPTRPRRLVALGVLCAAFAVGAFLVPGSGQARANDVSCGETITTSTTLDSDLVNCPNNGVVIGADNITLDLNGHTVSGDGVPVESCPEGASCDVGIDNSGGHTSVTIKDGAVRGFNVGVAILSASGNRIERLASANNTFFGLIVDDSSETRIDHNSSVDDGISGLLMIDSNDNRIDHNSVAGTTGYALPIFGSSHNRFEQNVLEGDQHGFLLESSDQNEGSNDNEIRGNRISNGGSIEIAHSSDNRVEENTLRDPGDGILLEGALRTRVSDNSVTDAGVGFPDTGGFGILLDGADDSLLQRNAVTGGKGPAILVTSFESQDTSDRNVVSHNVASSRFSDGILVNANATATLLERNRANKNGHDGIEVDAAGTTVAHNTANINHDLGIEAVPGVIDGGGNRASGNGNPLECANVTCS
jgi:parallel beta-helix repeat protein